MTSNDDGSRQGGNVFPFPRIGFTLTPTTNLPTPARPPAPAPDLTATIPAPRTARRSPLDALNALSDPALTTPLIPYTPAPVPGMLPDTFRSEPVGDHTGPRLGALSLAAILAVAVAALRGTATVLTDLRQRRLDRAAENAPLREARLKHRLVSQQAAAKHSLAMQGISDKATQQRTKRVPSSHEWGSKTLGGGKSGSGGSKGSTPSSGSGGRRGPGSGSGSSKHGPNSSGKRHNGPGRKNNGLGGGSGRGTGSGSGSGKGNKNRDPRTGPKSPSGTRTPKSPMTALERGRDRRNTSRDNRRAARDKVRDGRIRAGGDRKQQVRDGRFQARQQLRKARADAKRQKNQQTAAVDAGRTTLADAAGKAVRKRLKKRRKNLSPPILSAVGKGKNTPPKSPTASGGRTKLATALKKNAQKAARKRLKQRRRNMTPPIWAAQGNTNVQAAAGQPGTQSATPQSPKQPGTAGQGGACGTATPKTNPTKKTKKKPASAGTTPGSGSANQRNGQGRWTRARAYARKKAAGHTPPPNGHSGDNNPPPGWASWDDYNYYLRAEHKRRMGYGQGARKSPFQNAGQAAAHAGATHTVERDDYPGAQAKRWEPDAITQGAPALPSTGPAALDTAPTPHTRRPGTSRPKEAIPMPPAPARQDPRLVKARKQAARTGHLVTAQARHMDAQHETEITLDGALDEYSAFKDAAFKTHDKCFKLAGRARQLRDTLALFALELSTKHNLIGALFTTAMARLSESMDLLARMADEMQISSLEAAEMAEAASNDLDDAYRPYNTATADAGLSTPSAPVHNET